MNWDAIGAIGEILSALAVVGSLIYIGRQFRHSSTQALHSIYQHTVSNFSANGQNAAVMFRGNQNRDDLTDVERYQYAMLLHDMHNAVSLIWEQYERGLVDKEGKDRIMKVASFYNSTPGGTAFWNGEILPLPASVLFSASYVDAIERYRPS